MRGLLFTWQTDLCITLCLVSSLLGSGVNLVAHDTKENNLSNSTPNEQKVKKSNFQSGKEQLNKLKDTNKNFLASLNKIEITILGVAATGLTIALAFAKKLK